MFALLLVFVSSVISQVTMRVGSVYLSKREGERFEYKPVLDTQNSIAFGSYNKSFLHTGWDMLVLETSSKGSYDDDTLSEAIGFLEGYITQDTTWLSFQNIFNFEWHDTNFTMPQYIEEFMTAQTNWIETSIKDNPQSDYWNLVSCGWKQAQGMFNGYNAAAPANEKLKYLEYQVMNSPDLDDYKNLKNRKDFFDMSYSDLVKHITKSTSCSGFVKLDNNMNDIWMGHTTWESPSTMNRIFKTYTIHLSNSLAISDSVSFPGYPGCVVSQDDIYSTSSNLLVLETTNNIWDTSLWDLLTPKSLQSWMRVLVANRAGNCSDWMNLMGEYNSGTYNNQWLCLDLKLFKPGEDLVPGTLFCGEQIPGEFLVKDVTTELEFGYFPSYNVPFFREIYNKSGYPKILKQKPNLLPLIDYERCVRANIFRRDQSGVTSTEKMKDIMRYNNYKKDPLEMNVPAFAVAARYDLDETQFTGICHMGTDAKITSYSEWMNGKTWNLIAGPVYGGDSGIPNFSWSTTKTCDLSWMKHEGQPETFNFGYISYTVPPSVY